MYAGCAVSRRSRYLTASVAIASPADDRIGAMMSITPTTSRLARMT